MFYIVTCCTLKNYLFVSDNLGTSLLITTIRIWKYDFQNTELKIELTNLVEI